MPGLLVRRACVGEGPCAASEAGLATTAPAPRVLGEGLPDAAASGLAGPREGAFGPPTPAPGPGRVILGGEKGSPGGVCSAAAGTCEPAPGPTPSPGLTGSGKA